MIMLPTIRSWTLVLTCALALPAFAQPYRFGCHYFRNESHHPHRPTDFSDREGIQNTIARSELPFEFMLNALRLTGGFDAALFGERTGLPLTAINRQLDEAEQRGLIERDIKHIRPKVPVSRFPIP